EVQIDLVGSDIPAVVARLAGSEEAVLDLVAVFAENLYRVGLAAALDRRLVRPGPGSQVELGALDEAGRIPQRVPERGPSQRVASALQSHVTPRLDLLVLFGILEQVGADRQIALGQPRIARRAGLAPGRSLDAVGVESDRSVAVVLGLAGARQLQALSL